MAGFIRRQHRRSRACARAETTNKTCCIKGPVRFTNVCDFSHRIVVLSVHLPIRQRQEQQNIQGDAMGALLRGFPRRCLVVSIATLAALLVSVPALAGKPEPPPVTSLDDGENLTPLSRMGGNALDKKLREGGRKTRGNKDCADFQGK